METLLSVRKFSLGELGSAFGNTPIFEGPYPRIGQLCLNGEDILIRGQVAFGLKKNQLFQLSELKPGDRVIIAAL